jgi:hypothetical protein
MQWKILHLPTQEQAVFQTRVVGAFFPMLRRPYQENEVFNVPSGCLQLDSICALLLSLTTWFFFSTFVI